MVFAKQSNPSTHSTSSCSIYSDTAKNVSKDPSYLKYHSLFCCAYSKKHFVSYCANVRFNFSKYATAFTRRANFPLIHRNFNHLHIFPHNHSSQPPCLRFPTGSLPIHLDDTRLHSACLNSETSRNVKVLYITLLFVNLNIQAAVFHEALRWLLL